jgi:hypothetical protein
MLKERRLIAEQVAQQLFAAEAAIDAAIAATATLTGLMPSIRQTAGLSAQIGQDALAEAAETCAMLVRARGSIVATHNALTVAQKQMGLGAVNFGGLVIKPLASGETRHLAAVEQAA